MPRMRAPYTGVVFDVQPENVDERLARGFALLEPHYQPETGPESEDPEVERELAAEESSSDAPKPTAGSTIAEMRAWAKANGIELPKKGNKAALLEAIEGVGA